MSKQVYDVFENYKNVKEKLVNLFDEVNGYDFYQYIFPNNENKGEVNVDFSKPNAIYLYRDEKDNGTKRTLRRRIMLKDTWEEDYTRYVDMNPLTLCSGLAYRGRTNHLEKAQQMNALIFDLDGVGELEIKNVLARIGKEPSVLRAIPSPTFIVMSGTGLHLYYVFEDPIDLFPNIKLQLKQLKYDLTFRIWEYKGTSNEKQVQYQSINQNFRMVGSINNKYDLLVKAFKTGERVTLDYMNSYAYDDKNKVDIKKRFRPTQYTLEEAEEKFPDWYQRVIVEGNKNPKKWHIKRDLYEWWLKQATKIKGGHRYFYLMCMVIYAVKCDVPKEEVKKDMIEMFGYLATVDHSNPLTKEDIDAALEVYDRGYYNFTINDIEKLTDIRIERNKRNYRNQELHLRGARAIQEINDPDAKWRNLAGRPSKKEIIVDYIKKNPNDSPTTIAKRLKVSRTTVYKYLNS